MRFLSILLLISTIQSHAKTLKVALPNPIGILDPRKTLIAQDTFVLPLIYQFLFVTDAQGEVKPQLVKSWDFDSKNSVATIELNEGNTFSDGAPVDNQAVLNAFKLLCSKDSAAASLLASIAGCKKGSPEIRIQGGRLKFKVTTHKNSFLSHMATGQTPIFKIGNGNSMVGSGRFVIAQKSADEITLQGRDGPNSNTRIRFTHKEPEELKNTIDQFHMALMYLPSFVRDSKTENFDLSYQAPTISQTLVLNPTYFPFNHEEVREYLKAALYNDPKILECSAKPHKAFGFVPKGIGGSIASEAPAIMSGPSVEKVFKKVPALKDKAKKVVLLRHLGRKNPCEEDIIVQHAKAIGIDLSFEHLDSYDKLIPKYKDMKTPGFIELFVLASRDPGVVLRRFVPGNGSALFFFTSPYIQKEMSDAAREPQIEQAFGHYRKIVRYIDKAASVIPLYYLGHTNMIHKCLSASRDKLFTQNPDFSNYLDAITASSVEGCPNAD